MIVIEMDDREVYKVEKMVTNEWTKANSSDTEVLDSKSGSCNHTCISFHL